MAAISNSLIGAAGEYLVAAEMSRRGWLATVTIKNAPGTDVLAQHHADKKVVAIQVKSTLAPGKWLMSKGDETPSGRDNEWVALVTLGASLREASFWLLPRDHVALILWVSHRRWLQGTKRGGGKRKDGPMRAIFEHDIEPYKEAWETLRHPTTAVNYSLLPEWYREGEWSVRDPRIGLRSDHPGIRSLEAVAKDPSWIPS